MKKVLILLAALAGVIFAFKKLIYDDTEINDI